MYNVHDNIQTSLGHFSMENRWFRYNSFVPRLYNWAKKLGLEAGQIMPSRAFCSDESQGYPIILMTKHFGTFPFDHGRVGAIMSVDRHGPHAHHGKDLLIVHASHVGYIPETQQFGSYRRSQMEHGECSSNCGKIRGTLDWYIKEYNFACDHILIDMRGDHCRLTIDNHYLSRSRERSLVLFLERMIELHDGEMVPLSIQSTSRTFRASQNFYHEMKWSFSEKEGKQPIGKALVPEYFGYRTGLEEDYDDKHQLEVNLIGAMPWIVTSDAPMLTAAQANTQAEFDRAFRSISQEPGYQDKNLLYVSGLHVDISPAEGELFPLTKFIPWAAYVQLKSGERYILEQDALFKALDDCSPDNPDQISLDDVIQTMEEAQEVKLNLPA